MATIIITLKERIITGDNCGNHTSKIECDTVIADPEIVPIGLICCRTKDKPSLFLPLENVLGMTYKIEVYEKQQ